MNDDRGTSPWLYIGLGCLLAVVLLVGTIVGLFYLGARKAKQMAEEMADPDAREAKVQALLGYDETPAGYYPAMSFSIPMLFRVAILTDEPSGPSGQPELGSASFVFLEVREFGDDQEQLRAYLEGRAESADILERTNVTVGGRRDLGSHRPEPLARGAFEEAEVGYLWSAHPVELHLREGRVPGVETLVMAECPRRDRRVRLAVWSVPLSLEEDWDPEAGGDGDPTAEHPAGVDLTGTPADEEAVRAFLGHLRLCPG